MTALITPGESPRVLALVADEDGCTLWRVWQPYAELARHGYIAAWTHKDESGVERYAQMYDVVILPRLSWRAADQAKARTFIRSLHRAGLRVIYEVDDDVFTDHSIGHLAETTKRGTAMDQLRTERDERVFALNVCDGATVSSRRLATVLRQFVPDDYPIQVVENYVDVGWWRAQLRVARKKIRGLTLGYAGGIKALWDLEPMIAAWHDVAKRYPHVQFVTVGHCPPELEAAVPDERLHKIKWQSVDLYPQAVAQLVISCCPVADRPFSRCKTPIKLFESAMAGAAAVCSPTLYGPHVNDGADGLIAETAAEWTHALSRLVEDDVLRGEVARNQRRRVLRERSLAWNAWRWPAAWRRIVDSGYVGAEPASRLLLATA